MIKPPLSTNLGLMISYCNERGNGVNSHFMLLVPDASVPAVEMCSEISDAGTKTSALLTL